MSRYVCFALVVAIGCSSKENNVTQVNLPAGHCVTNEDCQATSGICLRGSQTCAPKPAALEGKVYKYEVAGGNAPRSDVTVEITNVYPTPRANPTTVDGNYTMPELPRGSLLDVELSFAQGALPASIRTRVAAQLNDKDASIVNLPSVSFAWMAKVASECGIFPTKEDAEKNVPYFLTRSTVFGELTDSAGKGVAGVGRADIEVVLGTWSNRDGSDPDTKVCFVERDSLDNYVGSKRDTTSDAGRFVMFRVRNDTNATGQGIARVIAKGFISQTVVLRASGNIGVVRLSQGADVPPPPPPLPTYEANIYPLFKSLFCAGCHAPGQPGYESSIERDGKKMDLSGTPDEVYQILMAGSQAGCDTATEKKGRARICLAKPENSSLLTMPLVEPPGQEDGHATVSFYSTTDVSYRTILEWIRAGAKR